MNMSFQLRLWFDFRRTASSWDRVDVGATDGVKILVDIVELPGYVMFA